MYREEQTTEKTKNPVLELEIEAIEEKLTAYDQVLEELKEEEGSLIKILHQGQKIFGYLPREILIYTAQVLGVPFPEIYGVVSFYSLFSMKPRGEYTIEICTGTACYVKGAEEVLDEFKKQLDIEPGEISEDGKYSLETTRCVGACSLAPVVSKGDDVYTNVTPEQVAGIIAGEEEAEEKKEEIFGPEEQEVKQ